MLSVYAMTAYLGFPPLIYSKMNPKTFKRKKNKMTRKGKFSKLNRAKNQIRANGSTKIQRTGFDSLQLT